MIRKAAGRAPRGTRKVLEWQRKSVIAVLVVVAMLGVAMLWLSSQGTKATGDAQEVYYAALEYMTQLAATAQPQTYVGTNPETSCLADNRPVLKLVDKSVEGEFFIQVNQQTGVLNYVSCKRKVALPGGYILELTGVFPQNKAVQESRRIYKPAQSVDLGLEGSLSDASNAQ